MKYLIVSGDSNTTDNFESISHPDRDFSYKKWPEILAEKLGMKCINVARCGMGNEFIYSSLKDVIINIKNKDEIGLVIAAWSQAPRKDFKSNTLLYDSWSSLRIDTHGYLPYWVQKSLGYFMSFQILCERYNIPYVQFQMIELYEHCLNGLRPSEADVVYNKKDPDTIEKYPGDVKRDEKIILEEILKYEKLIDTSKFIGWPISRKLGGFRIKDTIDLWHNTNSILRVSKFDNHPNEKGHKKLGKTIYGLLEKRILN